MDKSEIFLGVMALQEAKNHQLKLKSEGVELILKTHGETCTTGCKVTVEVWASEEFAPLLQNYFKEDYLKNVQGHEPNFDHLSAVFDPQATEVICQACGMNFSPNLTECPDCGLCYS